MNRADRRRYQQAEARALSNPRTARAFLKEMKIGPVGAEGRPLFPLELMDGRTVDAASATDADIMEIVKTLKGKN